MNMDMNMEVENKDKDKRVRQEGQARRKLWGIMDLITFFVGIA